MDRWFNLVGADNVRDLGGLPTRDGASTRPGQLLRGDTVQELTKDDVVTLRNNYGLRTVIDLRAEAEIAREGRGPLAAEAVAYHNLSFLPGEFVMADDPRYPLIVADRASQDRVEHYLDYLRGAPDAVAGALRLLADPGRLPALFHCAAGKDRTGVLAAVVLDIAGVERDAVIADYVASNERIDRVDRRLARRPTYDRARSSARTDGMSCRPEVISRFLTALDDTWGGAAGWARHAGVPDDALRSLRANLTD
ncbi:MULTISPECIES: tyrosine-protein phosphatase [Protofrankia]|uniref:Protein tyrosine/serine phosphatase n=1 Tax=Candidatus Protofrankia datiscae TaxID=2716812 RepID=F8B2G3_9ACTN|nr:MULTISPECIES: tyrosine-protein phosphatase [Protofrankia]AEH10844.1 protein tyrosine/serine phosphatase [Candidatus Protofrankia datiscae]